jgi:hypothetical protein
MGKIFRRLSIYENETVTTFRQRQLFTDQTWSKCDWIRLNILLSVTDHKVAPTFYFFVGFGDGTGMGNRAALNINAWQLYRCQAQELFD